jgi:hypothetical protein
MKFQISHRGDFLLVELFGTPVLRDLLLCAQSCERFQAARAAIKNWMIDLTSVPDFQVGLYEMNVIARRFDPTAHAGSIRCAMLVQSLPDSGGARRLRTLKDRTEIDIRLFQSSGEALLWFGSKTKFRQRR